MSGGGSRGRRSAQTAPSSGGKPGTRYTSFMHDGVLFKVGDAALFNPEDSNSLPYVGKILGATQQSADNEDLELSVMWFYRPEEAAGGRRVFHGCRELFSSDHADVVHKDSIICQCTVHTLKNYEALPMVGAADYFARFAYKIGPRHFEPDQVPVYCKCELPYNPDRPMTMCDGCGDWFHMGCVGDAAPQPSLPYFCPDCQVALPCGPLHLSAMPMAGASHPNKRARTALSLPPASAALVMAT